MYNKLFRNQIQNLRCGNYTIYSYKFGYSITLVVFAVLFSAGKSVISSDEIVLKNEKLDFTPTAFYIANVIDSRKVKRPIATLVSIRESEKSVQRLQAVDLRGGTLSGIKNFIEYNLPKNKKLHPIELHLNEVQVLETNGSYNQVEGKVTLNFSYYLIRNGNEKVHLLDYTGGARYGRGNSQQQVVEAVLRQSLGSALAYLNTWMDKQAGVNEKLATSIKVNFSELHHTVVDTTYYDPNRPLTWNDFSGTPNEKSVFAASVFPGFGYKGETEIVNGVIHLNLTMQVFVVQRSSWVKSHARNPYSLNHEQKHFDIVKLVAERFKSEIKPDSLTLSDYNSIIQFKYIQAYREMNRIQDLYDRETKHGIDRDAQIRWNKYIKTELKKCGVYPTGHN